MPIRRDEIINAMAVRFKKIVNGFEFTVNGVSHICQTNIGQYVFRRRVVPLDRDEIEMLVFVDTVAPPKNVAGGFVEYDMLVEIGYQLRGDDTALDKAVKAGADLLAAIGSDSSWGGLADNTSLVDADLDFHVVDKILAGFSVPIRIKYQVPNWTL